MIHPELARLYFREIEKLALQPNLPLRQLVVNELHLLELLFQEVTREERIIFSTLFARMAFAFQKRGVNKRLQFVVHHFRKQGRGAVSSVKPVPDELPLLGLRVLADATAALFGEPVPNDLQRLLPGDDIYPSQDEKIIGFEHRVRVLVLADESEHKQLIGKDVDRQGQDVRIQYGIAERNDNFNGTIALIRKYFGFPLQLNLIDVEIDSEGVYRPRAFIVEPDFLVDVTSIAECIKPDGHFTAGYLLRKFLPTQQSKHLMIGNIANFFLDELMTDPKQTFRNLFPKVFRLNPLAFALFDDKTVSEILDASKKHFVNIRAMVEKGFQARDIDPQSCFLEPTFYSETYGLQGRLDIFQFKPGKKGSAIIELKSGKTFKPNQYGINQNHYTQTLLYDLIIRSVFGKRTDPLNYILYSLEEVDGLKYAPVVSAKQMEAMEVRNELLAIERQLTALSADGSSNPFVFARLSALKASGFDKNGLDTFLAGYSGASELERRYFLAFTGMVAREQQLARVGVEGLDQINGLAALWRSTVAEKEEQFEMLRHLEVVHAQQASADEPLVTFRRSDLTNPLANFRKGDIAVLYPAEEEEATVLQGQVFKCTLIDINDQQITLRLRSRQFNTSLFKTVKFWNLEHDMLDGGFISMYRQLFAFLQAPGDRRHLWLGLQPPSLPEQRDVKPPFRMTVEQEKLFNRIINAKDYFLLWGPPGTGKTSMMLRAIVGHLWQETDENLLILAYTNRAVDEICEAISAFHSNIRNAFLRIGSRFSTDARFQNNLLSTRLESVKNRADLRQLLQESRIVVSTVASIANRVELFQLKSFDRLILDEASQVIEPMLVGILPLVPRAILIGDHRQLPAVVTQSQANTTLQPSALADIGLDNLRNSLFDRLYRLATTRNWTHAFGQLTHQGRMHEAIMEFPNLHFYKGQLRILPEELPEHLQQKEPLKLVCPHEPTPLEQFICEQRVLFLPSGSPGEGMTAKTNAFEAERIIQIIRAFKRVFSSSGQQFSYAQVGIIAPYRAQIALIKNRLQEEGLFDESLTVDTVERYQGGARDIILMSVCANHIRQLQSLVNLSSEGVDRKLNVALTRARHHLILIGNPDILQRDQRYADFIRKYSANASVSQSK